MCAFFILKYLQLLMKISLLYEINLFDNSVNMYSSNSGHTFENRYSQSFELWSGRQDVQKEKDATLSSSWLSSY